MSREKEEDRKFDLFKMEYERAAERYENIYKAIWQNFSYLAVVSGGILAFGPDAQLPIEVVVTAALLPLVFWFLVTYLPMDRYGNLARARLGAIEAILNEEYFPGAKETEKPYDDQRFGEIPVTKHLNHYSGFYGFKLKKDFWFPWRVRHAMMVFGTIVTVVFSAAFYSTICHYVGEQPEEANRVIELEAKPIEVQVRNPELQDVQSAIEALSEQVRALELRLQESTPDTTE